GDGAHPPQQAQAEQQATPDKHDEGKVADKATDTDQLPPASTTQHSVTLGGTTFSYSATAGTIPLHNPQGKTLANVFYVAYTREPEDAKRPVTFVFNGGPGAAPAYLDLRALGPRAVEGTPTGGARGPPPPPLSH